MCRGSHQHGDSFGPFPQIVERRGRENGSADGKPCFENGVLHGAENVGDVVRREAAVEPRQVKRDAKYDFGDAEHDQRTDGQMLPAERKILVGEAVKSYETEY